MPNFICTTCGTQHAESEQPPAACAICEDDRQYLKVTGQQWTTMDRLRLTNRNSIRFEEAGLTGIGIDPHFAIGQRLLVRTPKGNILWDCVPLLDPALVEMVKTLGGISAIAISRPHYYWAITQQMQILLLQAVESDPLYLARPTQVIDLDDSGPLSHLNSSGALQQAQGDPWRSPATLGDFAQKFRLELPAQGPASLANSFRKLVLAAVIQVQD